LPGVLPSAVNGLPYVGLALVFFGAFGTPRRPLSVRNLDLAVLLAVGSLHLYAFQSGHFGQEASPARGLVLVAGLLYLLTRMLMIGFGWRARREPPEHRSETLTALARPGWLAAGVACLALGHAVYPAVDDTYAIDVGLFSSAGSDRLVHHPGALYEDLLRLREYGEYDDHARYGPAMYLFYAPFEQVFPWQRSPRAAMAAAVVFDLLTALALWLFGRRLLGGPPGNALGLSLALAWLSFPYTLFGVAWAFNDALVGLLLVCVLLVLQVPLARGGIAALAAAAKFVPLALVPVFATATGRQQHRATLLFSIAFAAVVLLLFIPVMPDGGPRELYDRTVGFQASRAVGGEVTIWNHYSLVWLQTLLRAAAVGLAVLFAFVPSRKTPVQVAALGAAALIALQLTPENWAASYMLWFAPLAFIALFAPERLAVASSPER